MIEKNYVALVALMDCLVLIFMAMGTFLAAYAVYLLVLWF